ncbi:MAG: NAD(P)/FAD-dependent oxidoreductase [Chromatiales bacterium]|nr:NAD(P)/FAD-dependent oxidoreductase [Chromatiales bacterium]
MSGMTRRNFIRALGAGSATAALAACGAMPGKSGKAHVVVIGGGPGGATCAKYLKRFDSSIQVTLVEPNTEFYTCFGSNWVIGGLAQMSDIKQSYASLKDKHGINIVHDMATGIDPVNRKVTLKGGGTLSYDKLVVSPGIDFKWEGIEGYSEAAIETMPHAWKAGPQTTLLRRQLEAMPDGGTFVMVAPGNPFRCPPGPYERASMVAHYFKTHKPKSKIIILDNKEKFSKQGLFVAGWKALYGDMIEWVQSTKGGKVERVDVANKMLYADGGLTSFKGDVVNFIPSQKAGKIAFGAGLTNDAGWCPVDQMTFESTLHKDVHVIGDSSVAGTMPKSGHSANTQGKVTAAAIVLALQGKPMEAPSFVNTCFSLVGPEYGISVAAVYKFTDGSIKGVQGAGGVSPADAPLSFRKQEANYARGWYASITDDTWG